ncbi:MAG: hypothetical protein WDW38_003450 [Sanguina aurantia]
MAQTAQDLHPTSPRTFHHGITYTSYQGNTFALKFNTSGSRILVDPWLVGDLTFMEQTWLYRGLKNDTAQVVNVKQILDETDLIILTQSLDDHTHLPTLKLLPRDIPIIANPDAAARIAPLGFTNVLTIEHGQTRVACDGRVKITATAGALVGPPWSKRQSGIVFQETTPGAVSVYYEPHCDFEDSSVRAISPVDVVISPVKSVIMQIGPIPYPLVQGDLNLMKLMKMLKPKVLIPLLNTETKQEGPLALLLSERGDYQRVAQELQEAGLSTRVEFPAPSGEALAIAL